MNPRCSPRMAAHRRRRGGMTLVEVVIAVAIAGIAFAVLAQSFADTLNVLSTLATEADTQGTVRFARSQIILEPDRDAFEDGGELQTLDMGTCKWEADVEDTAVVDLFRVTLSMEFERPDNKQGPLRLRETLYLLRPTWSDPVDRSQILAEAQERLFDERELEW